MPGPLVGTANAENIVVAKELHGGVHLQLPGARAADFVRPFDVAAEAAGFVGRDAHFEAIAAFAAAHARGYVEIVGGAGLGKTALAAEIARRRDAIVFFTSVGRGTQHARQLLTHVSAELIVRHLPDRSTLPADAGGDSTVMVHLMREAVERTGVPLWIVVDALDEAEEPPPGANPLLLPPELPEHVYVVVTRRSGAMLSGPGTPVLTRTLRSDDPQQIADLAQFIRARMLAAPRIDAALARTVPPIAEPAFVETLGTKSDGNFAYVDFVLADIEETDGPVDLRALPERLNGYYDQFWARMSLEQKDWVTWRELHKPVLERLTVAGEAVTADWLGDQISRDGDEVEARVLNPWSRLLSRSTGGRPAVWRIVHRSFADYLEKTGKVKPAEVHLAVARSYLGGPPDGWDDYGLRHTATHLAEAVVHGPGPDAPEHLWTLARLVVETRLQRRQLELGDPALIESGLERARDLVAAADLEEATYWLAPIALALVGFRRELLKPEAIFEAARRGEVRRATVLLELLGDALDADWRDALTIAISWLAQDAAPADATALRADVRLRIDADGARSAVLAHLLARADGGAPQPLGVPVPTLDAVHDILARLTDYGLEASWGHGEMVTATGYASTVEAPEVVALAIARPEVGDALLATYITAHAAYGYWEYRSGSLWWLFDAVLAHPDPERTRDLLAGIGRALLAPVRGSFFEGLALACVAVEARAGDAEAGGALEASTVDALGKAAHLPIGGGTADAGHTDRGDQWATHRRRLAALAEAQWALDSPRSAALLTAAIELRGGFAGFTAAAYLTLAEAAEIARPDQDVDVARWSLRYAMQAAQSIRDPVYSVRVSARVRALQRRWWPAPAALTDTIGRLVADPTAPEFASVHVVGEPLAQRPPDHVPAPTETALTLRALAELYRRPLDDFRRLNAAGPDEPLPDGADVLVPDPGFPPLLAARLAAAILATGVPRPDTLIRALVPIAGVEPTALATTLARLVLATPPGDPAQLAALRGLALRHADAAPRLGGR